MAEVIVIGAGLGGLACAVKLARAGKSVLLLEKNLHPGGTSYLFRRGFYAFPMGPLSFSYPARVGAIFKKLGAETPADYTRNHYQLSAPGLDIVMSHPLRTMQRELNKLFPLEVQGIEAVISKFEEIISSLAPEQDLRRPATDGSLSADSIRQSGPHSNERRAENLAAPSREFLERHISNRLLRNFLGSQGTEEPEMSLLTLARMWNAMSEVGIWYPRCGMHGLSDRLLAAFLAAGGAIRLGTPVKEIQVENGRAAGVQTASGEFLPAHWVVCSADYKKTFLEMLAPDFIPLDHLEKVCSLPYTGSELCVYLGVDLAKVDLSRMMANHVFYRKSLEPTGGTGLDNFRSRDIEICLWSQNMPDSAPAGKAALVLRVSFPYDYFARWRTGEKRRAEGYKAHKEALARKLVQNVESFLPGLGRSVELMEVATPLTYQDWGNRTRGSIAGWSWAAEQARAFGQKTLVETPLEGLIMCGIYSLTELFWGGVPTALTTGLWAAERILA
jgi:all-trans-retinol 13,14-reductase